MVFGWVKSKIKGKSGEDEYERIKQSIISRGDESSIKISEEEKPIIEKFRKDREILNREELLEPWERERIRRDEIRPEWRPLRGSPRDTTKMKKEEFQPIFIGMEDPEDPYKRRDVEKRGFEQTRAFEEPARIFEDNERINNRLKFIEEQLATIKAQNEVLIEKLRSIERKLGYV